MSQALRATLAALVLVAGAAIVGPTSAAGAPGDEGVALRLASQTAWVSAGQDFVLRVQVAGVPRPDEITLRVVVHRAVSSRSQFSLTLAGNSLGRAAKTTSAALSDLPVDAAGAIRVQLGPPGLTLSRFGVYPVEVTVRDGAQVLDRLITHLVYVPAAVQAPKLGVSWLLPLGAPPALQPDGSRRPVVADRLTVLAEALQSPGVKGLPLGLMPDPETLEALGAGSTEGERALLGQLRNAVRSRGVLGRPYAPIDVAALVRAGLGEEVAIQQRRGIQAVADVLGTRPDTRTWVVDRPVDDDALARLRDLQVDRVVVPEAALEPADLQLTLAQPFTLGERSPREQPAVVADRGLADHFTNRGDQVLAAHHFLADLAQLWLDAPNSRRAVVAVTPSGWEPSRAFLDAALNGLAQSPVVQAMSLDTVFSAIPPATNRLLRRPPRSGRDAVLVRRPATGLSPRLGAAPSRYRATRQHLDAFGSMLRPGSPVYGRLERQLLLAESADLPGDEKVRYLDGVAGSIAHQVDQLVLPRARTLTLTAREGEVPLSFLNRSKVPLTVIVRLQSDKLEFPARAERTIELPPRSTTLRFAVKTRTAGAFPLKVQLAPPRGSLALPATKFTVRSTAASGVGVVVSVGAGLFLLAWWGRNLGRGRRRRLVPT